MAIIHRPRFDWKRNGQDELDVRSSSIVWFEDLSLSFSLLLPPLLGSELLANLWRRRVRFFSPGNKQRAGARHSLSIERSSPRVKLCLFFFFFTMFSTRLHGKGHSSHHFTKGSRRPSFETVDQEDTDGTLQVDIFAFSSDGKRDTPASPRSLLSSG